MALSLGAALTTAAVFCVAVPHASAQRFDFRQAHDVAPGSTLEVTTDRGRIDIEAGTSSQVEIVGTVTVRVAWDVPANAVDLARRVASRPPVQATDHRLRLSVPSIAEERRAVTVSYLVRVPPGLPVIARSVSGAIGVAGVRSPVVVGTQSGAITAARVDAAEITTGSGAVRVSGATGLVSVTTESSALEVDGLAGALYARSGSGSVRADLVAGARADIETSSSAVAVRGAAGALGIRTKSGRVAISGDPAAEWAVSTGSGSIEITVPETAAFQLHATSRSGSVHAEGVSGATTSPRQVVGAVGGPGPDVRLDSRSGSIRVRKTDGS